MSYRFPNGRPGAGLLMLRVVVGVAVMLSSLRHLSVDGTTFILVIEILRIAGAAFVLIGLLTAVAASAVSGATLALSALLPGELTSGLNALLLASTALALALLGPGAWSIDARLFGRREIVIPRDSNT